MQDERQALLQHPGVVKGRGSFVSWGSHAMRLCFLLGNVRWGGCSMLRKKKRQLGNITLNVKLEGLHSTVGKQNSISASATDPAACRDGPFQKPRLCWKASARTPASPAPLATSSTRVSSLLKRPMTARNVTLPTQKGNTEIYSCFPWAKRNSLNITQRCQPLWWVNACAIRRTSLFKWHLYGRWNISFITQFICVNPLCNRVQVCPVTHPACSYKRTMCQVGAWKASMLTPLLKSASSSFL